MASREKWKISKTIPAALIITLAVAFFSQTVVFIYLASSWKTSTDNRLVALENRPDLTLQVARIETGMGYLTEVIKDLKTDVKIVVNRR